MKRSSLIITRLLFYLAGFGQDSANRITAKFITDPIQIDGIIDESVWREADTAGNLWQFFPVDSVRAKHQSEIRLLYDEHYLYAAIRAEVPDDKFVVSSLRRDFDGSSNDNVTIMFDTFRDGNNAFLFGVTPYGVQREAFLSEGGVTTEGFNSTWDIKWQTESKMYKDQYVVELAIPFTSLKFTEGDTLWRFQLYRFDFQTNEQSAWAHIPQNHNLSALAFMGDLVFEKPLGKSHTPVAIIPYVNALSLKDFETDGIKNKLKFGGDAKVAIGNGMNLDITLNPDFSNVEVDDIFTNLTRFEIFLPEKRQFFIDNNDLFGSFGYKVDVIPFFSRRIGLANDASGNLIENRIIGGTRLSGKINQDWRLGFLNVQTGEDPANGIASNNNMMFVIQKKVFSRSNIGLFMINRQTFKDYDFADTNDRYNRVGGVEYNLASADNVWTGKFYLHKSFQPDDKKGNFSSSAYLKYNVRNYCLATTIVYIDQDFRSDLGYVPRTGIFKTGNSLKRNFYPANGVINRHSFEFLSVLYWRPDYDFKKTDHELSGIWDFEFKNKSALKLKYSNNYIFLMQDFDPTRSKEGVPLPQDNGYFFNQVTTGYQSNKTNLLTYGAESTVGQFYNGHSFSAGGNLSYRMQPWVSVGMAVKYDGLRLPDPHSDADMWLMSPKLEVTFNKSLFWSALVQYSNQRDNLGINSRLQWRFAPMSDLYLVYNDNYFIDNFGPRFRSVNLKLTYWLTL